MSRAYNHKYGVKPVMDQVKLQATAKALRSKLDALKHQDPEVAELDRELAELLTFVEQGRIHERWEVGLIPGRWLFSERSLSRHGELELAYSRFQLEMMGGAHEGLAVIEAFLLRRSQSK